MRQVPPPMYGSTNPRFKHGMSETVEFRLWMGIQRRCYDASCVSYRYYGARGITVCDRWQNSFLAFLSDMGPRPTGMSGKRPTFSIERRDNDGPYSPDNCYWGTKSQQMRNTRHNRILTVHGCSLSVVEWAEQLGTLTRFQITDRLHKGWSAERALFQPIKHVSQDWRHP